MCFRRLILGLRSGNHVIISFHFFSSSRRRSATFGSGFCPPLSPLAHPVLRSGRTRPLAASPCTPVRNRERFSWPTISAATLGDGCGTGPPSARNVRRHDAGKRCMGDFGRGKKTVNKLIYPYTKNVFRTIRRGKEEGLDTSEAEGNGSLCFAVVRSYKMSAKEPFVFKKKIPKLRSKFK